jgi:hypothetical protein
MPDGVGAPAPLVQSAAAARTRWPHLGKTSLGGAGFPWFEKIPSLGGCARPGGKPGDRRLPRDCQKCIQLEFMAVAETSASCLRRRPPRPSTFSRRAPRPNPLPYREMGLAASTLPEASTNTRPPSGLASDTVMERAMPTAEQYCDIPPLGIATTSTATAVGDSATADL